MLKILNFILNAFFKWRGGQLGECSQLNYPCQLSCSSRISIGDYSYIGPEGKLFGKGGIRIGDNVIIGPRVLIYSSNHNFRNSKKIPYDKSIIDKIVIIEDGCWLGDSVKISPGVKIGRGSIIGLGCVITHDIPPYSIVKAGALIVKQRGSDDILRIENSNKKEDSYIYWKLKK
ncbi:acyltransferase [Chitinibacter sp. S2-10]|uniref:acyltransferase n=1 Tax=Chitinibacter sp. S2-10 TaxID=3373597 RepID=UPI003977BC83